MAPNTKPESMKVVARCRPLSMSEAAEGHVPIVQVHPPDTIQLDKDKAFLLDQAFGPSSTQEQVFNDAAKPIVDAVLDGYNGCMFAYGQTGSGKTFTMEGSEEQPGIMPRTFEYLVKRIAALSIACEYVIYLSFLEIYNDDVIDLLVKTSKGKAVKLDVKESKERGIYVNGLGQHVVQSIQDMMRKLQLGKRNRKVGETKMNQESSRSHSILTLTVVRVEGSKEAAVAAAAAVNSTPGPKPKKSVAQVSVGKLHLVDLAGSERTSKTGANGERLKEGISINKSLSALGNVMSALCDGKTGALVPYREAKLTRLLQDSLGGNSKTVMVANIGPADWNSDETRSTLNYAARARNIKNAPKINNDPADTMVQQYRQQVEKLAAEYHLKIAKLEEEHAAEVKQLKEELQVIQMSKAAAAQSKESARVSALQQQLNELQQERIRRQQQEAEVEALKSQLAALQMQDEQHLQQQQEQHLMALEDSNAAVPAAVASPVGNTPAAPEATIPPARGVAAAASPVHHEASSPRNMMSSGRYHKDIADLKSKIVHMQKEAIGDYQYLLQQSDELARLRARMLEEAGRRVQADNELLRLKDQLAGVHDLNAEQEEEMKRMQGLVESLIARGVRPRTAHAHLDVQIEGEEHQLRQPDQQDINSVAGARSLREDPGCNMLFEELVLELGYEAEAARQAIMAMPGGTTEEIIDYIIDKEAVFAAWRRLKASLKC